MTVVSSAADYLDHAQQSRTEVAQLDLSGSIEDAYAVQHGLLARRLARGERIAGTKLGMTSFAKRAQMGIGEVIVGQLTDAMRIADGGTCDLTGLIHPRVEPELAFRLERSVNLDDPNLDILACVDAVAPALEIIDSRYANFRFSLNDVVADNTSAAAFVVGSWTPLAPAAGGVGGLAVTLRIDGRIVESGTTAEILGHPFDALRALVPLAREHGFPLTGGQVILAGAATAAAPLLPGAVDAHVAGLGAVSFRALGGRS